MIRFNLPKVSVGFDTDFGTERVRHEAKLHTVILEPDFPRVSLVWHTHLPCHHKVLKLLTTKIHLKRRFQVSEHDRNVGVWVGEPQYV